MSVHLLFEERPSLRDHAWESLVLGLVSPFCASSVLAATSKTLSSSCSCFVLALQQHGWNGINY